MVGARWGFGAATVVAISVVLASPAGAHSCAEPVTITAKADTTVAISVTLGDQAPSEVRFDFDPSFEVAADVGRPGWTVEQAGSSVSFAGGSFDQGGCETFDVPVRATTDGTFRVRAYQTLATGQIVEHPPSGDVYMNADGSSYVVNREGAPNPLFEQVIYVEPAEPQQTTRTGLLVVSGVALVIVAFVLIGRRSGDRAASVDR